MWSFEIIFGSQKMLPARFVSRPIRNFPFHLPIDCHGVKQFSLKMSFRSAIAMSKLLVGALNKNMNVERI